MSHWKALKDVSKVMGAVIRCRNITIRVQGIAVVSLSYTDFEGTK